MSSARLGALQLPDVGELPPATDQLPQPHGRLTGGGVDQYRAEEALPVLEAQYRDTPPTGGRHDVVLGLDLVVGGGVGDRLVDQSWVETELAEQLTGDVGLVRFAALDMQRGSSLRVPGVEQRRVGAAQQRTDPHHRPTVGPGPLPRVLLALDTVDLLQREEAPAHLDAGVVAHLPDPPRRLEGVGAHDVEVEVDGGGRRRADGSDNTWPRGADKVQRRSRQAEERKRRPAWPGNAASAFRVEDAGEVGPSRQVQLGVHLVQVVLDRSQRHNQPLGDLPVGETPPRQQRHLELPRGQWVVTRR